ncbi:sodium/bile acid cotransporter [Acipenser oxyrinchus oxyrinchus]|uniref:Sodium/bile acid cotransporter n=1 Tax=Acipenser oxyrinchus oxyrinchus TaxID=40147 RepID=A0AAD8CY91_ACIOX|nr:sodium/bile acid cotransporter [Acipenser oxyrinchus oxyrinchus]
MPNATMNQTEETYSGDSYWYHEDILNVTVSNSTSAFQSPFSPLVDKAISCITIIILFITMVSLGCAMEIFKIKAHILKPKGVAIAVVAQYGIMPLTAFALAKAFQLGSIESVTVLICGCCPGGNLSNIFALALKGDMNLSLCMWGAPLSRLCMWCAPLSSLCMWCAPLSSLCMWCAPLSSLCMWCAPLSSLCMWCAPVYSLSVLLSQAGMSILLLASVAIAVLSGMVIGSTIWSVLSPTLIGTAAFMPLTGYLLGYILSSLFRLNEKCKRTASMETGYQNIQLCCTILKVAFRAEVIGRLYLFPLIYILFQAGEALLFIVLFRCYVRMRPQADGKYSIVYVAVDSKVDEVKLPQTRATLIVRHLHASALFNWKPCY